jgi:hypothetical protein
MLLPVIHPAETEVTVFVFLHNSGQPGDRQIRNLILLP